MHAMKRLKGILFRMFKKNRSVKQHLEEERVKAYAANTSNIKLHFGCGPRVLKGWVNIDLAFEPYENYLQYYGDAFYSAEIRGTKSDFFAIDITKERLPLQDNSVDVIFHEDFIEHLDQRSQMIFLAETLRVLKPGCIHRVNTPDLKTSMLNNSEFARGGAGVYVDEWDKHGHKNILTPNILAEMAKIVGYREIRFTGRNGSSSPTIPREYRPDPNDRAESGNIFADLLK
jgi:predicted SAM-dependent methyltransferase